MSKPRTSLATAVRTNLREPVDLVDRVRELDEIITALSPATRAWIISLTGVGGIGKTELAIKVAHTLANAKRKLFDSIIWTTAKDSWLTHEGIQPLKPQYAFVSIDELLNTIIDVLGIDGHVRHASPESKRKAVMETLRSRPCLIIVDNLETIYDEAVIQFLMELPGTSKALVTTRLGGLKAPDAAPAQTLEGQREIRIFPLSQEDAITLFRRRAEEHDLPVPATADTAILEQIVRKAGYIPLAIEWIIGQMALNGDTLETTLSRLDSVEGPVLQYCFNNLIAKVSARAKRILLAVSIFADSVSQELLSDITGIDDEDLTKELRLLNADSLVEKIGKRFSILASTRLYVNTLQRDMRETYEEYSLKVVNHYLHLLSNLDHQPERDALKAEQQNMLSLLTWCFDNDFFDEAFALALALNRYLSREGLWDQRTYVCELATQAATSLGDNRKAIEFTFDAAEIHKARERLDEALEEFQRCEAYSKEIGDQKTAADAHMQIGIVLYNQEKYAESIRVLRQSLKMYQSNNDEQGVAQCLTNLGRNELRLGNFEGAKRYFEEGLSIKKQIGDQLGIAISQYDLGHFYHQSGNLQKAGSLLKEAIAMLTSLRVRRHQANALWYYALLQIDQGNLEAAKDTLQDVVSAEELLQRPTKIKRAEEKQHEIELAQTSDKVPASSIKQRKPRPPRAVKPRTLATRVISILLSSLSPSDEKSTTKAASQAHEKARSIISLLQERWHDNQAAMQDLHIFEENPVRYKSVLEDTLQKKLAEDEELGRKLSQLLK